MSFFSFHLFAISVFVSEMASVLSRTGNIRVIFQIFKIKYLIGCKRHTGAIRKLFYGLCVCYLPIHTHNHTITYTWYMYTYLYQYTALHSQNNNPHEIDIVSYTDSCTQHQMFHYIFRYTNLVKKKTWFNLFTKII